MFYYKLVCKCKLRPDYKVVHQKLISKVLLIMNYVKSFLAILDFISKEKKILDESGNDKRNIRKNNINLVI